MRKRIGGERCRWGDMWLGGGGWWVYDFEPVDAGGFEGTYRDDFAFVDGFLSGALYDSIADAASRTM
jgi:hypothetical protein